MSILSNSVDIASDERRVCAQQIDISEDFNTSCIERHSKRRKLMDNNSINSSEGRESTTTHNSPIDELFGNCSPNTINDLCPEVFQLIIAKYLKSTNWRKLVPLRLVSKFWRNNIDSYLASRHGFQYTGRLVKGSPPPVMNYYEFNAMLSFYPNMRQLIVKNFTVSDHLVAILRQNVPNLERISLYGCRSLSWKGITILAVRFPQLKFIDVSNCELDENRY